jgi:hypothetical protein
MMALDAKVRRSTVWIHTLLLGGITGILGIAYGSTLAPSITWANGGADSGDFVAAAATLGIAHPTGYPTYLLLVHAFQQIPLGDLAYRANLCSLVMAVLAALGVYLVVLRHSGGAWHGRLAAVTAALALGLSPLFWSQAVIAEVHTLHALFVILIIGFTLDPQLAQARSLVLQAALVGLALGNHVTIALLALVWMVAVIKSAPNDRFRRLTTIAFGLGCGLLVYLYLPIRAQAQPPINWGSPHDWQNFWWVVAAHPYHDLAFGLPTQAIPARIAAWAVLLIQQFGWIGIVVGFIGLIYSTPFKNAWLLILTAFGYSIFAITYNTADSNAYLLPAYCIFAIYIGLGAAYISKFVELRRRFLGALVFVALLGVVLYQATTAAPRIDASRDRRATEFAHRVLGSAPQGAIIVTTSDRDTFPLWYYHYALGARPDVLVIAEPLLGFQWYRENLHAVYSATLTLGQNNTNWATFVATGDEGKRQVCRTALLLDNTLRCTDS